MFGEGTHRFQPKLILADGLRNQPLSLVIPNGSPRPGKSAVLGAHRIPSDAPEGRITQDLKVDLACAESFAMRTGDLAPILTYRIHSSNFRFIVTQNIAAILQRQSL